MKRYGSWVGIACLLVVMWTRSLPYHLMLNLGERNLLRFVLTHGHLEATGQIGLLWHVNNQAILSEKFLLQAQIAEVTRQRAESNLMYLWAITGQTTKVAQIVQIKSTCDKLEPVELARFPGLVLSDLTGAVRWLNCSGYAEQLAPYLFERADWLRENGFLDESERDLTQAVTWDPGYAVAWIALGELSLQQQNYAQAKNFFQQALKINGDAIAPYVGLAKIAVQEQDLVAGRRYIAFAIKHVESLNDSSLLGQIYLTAASVEELGTSFSTACDIYANLLTIPNYPLWYPSIRAAQVCTQAGHYDTAVAWAQRATKLDPKRVDAWKVLGNIHSQFQNWAAAIQSFEVALEIAPADIDTRLNMAWSYRQQGRLQEARTTYQLVLTYDPDNATAQKALRELGIEP